MSNGGFVTGNGIQTDQVAVLDAVLTQLRTVTTFQGENTAFLSMHTEPLDEMRQNVYATVCPMSGQFDEALFRGYGVAYEATGFIVNVFSQMRLDRPDGDVSMLTDATRGLLVLKKQVLDAFTNHILVDTEGNGLLSSSIRPINSSHPNRDDEGIGTFSLMFATDFSWNLSF